MRPRLAADQDALARFLLLLALVSLAVVSAWLGSAPLLARETPALDPDLERQWHLRNRGQLGGSKGADADVLRAWSITQGHPRIVVAVIDQGVHWQHEDLRANIAAGMRDFSTDPPGLDASARELDWHGTLMAGIIAAVRGNGLGGSGVAPGCRLLPVRISHVLGPARTAAAIRYAARYADVLACSWGMTTDTPESSELRRAVQDAATTGRGGLGCVVVFAASREEREMDCGSSGELAALPEALAVGISNDRDQREPAGTGLGLDLLAPSRRFGAGAGIWSTNRPGGSDLPGPYAAAGGTSAAAAVVSGVAALLLSLNPELTAWQVRELLTTSAMPIDASAAKYDADGFSPTHGHGRVDAYRALSPFVRIAVEPSRLRVGERFSVRVTASAPFGLEELRWSGTETGELELDYPHVRSGRGAVARREVWSGLRPSHSGRFRLIARARGRQPDLPRNVSIYPRESETAEAFLEVSER